MKIFRFILIVFLILGFVNCATDEAMNLEDARFALDKGYWDDAITKATKALNDNPNSVDAARILASAYFGRSGLDFLDLAEGIVDLENDSAESDLRRIADVLPATATMADVRSAITTLNAFSGITAASLTENEDLADAAFDLGMMMAIEQFALGVYGSNYKTTFDPTAITDDNKANVQSDLVDFDNRLTASGVSSTETFINDTRKTFCVLEPLSSGEGFTTAEYQAWVGCELSSNPSAFDPSAISPNIAACSAIDPDNQSAAVQACYSQNTSL